jgi:hypothetical protein
MMSVTDDEQPRLRGEREPIYVGGFRLPTHVDVIVSEYSSEPPFKAPYSIP